MKIWWRTHSIHQCSWTVVWQYLREAFKRIGVEIHDDMLIQPERPEEYVEMWWGDVSKWEWSGLNVKAKVGYCISEHTVFPPKLKKNILANLAECNLLICASDYSARAFREAPISCPIAIVPLGVDTKQMQYVDREWKGTFKYLLAGAAQFRKGTWLGIEAFLKAKTMFSRMELTVWSSVHTPDRDYLKKTYKHKSVIFDDSIVNNPFEIYEKHHVLLSPHLSEGFGLTLPEAMSTGMPCIVARTSSPLEIFKSDFGWWIEMTDSFVPVDNCLEDTHGYWRLPDVNNLAEKIFYAYTNKDECKKKGLNGSQYIRENLTWEDTALDLISITKEVSS